MSENDRLITCAGEVRVIAATAAKGLAKIEILCYTGKAIHAAGWDKVVIDIAGLKAPHARYAVLQDHLPAAIVAHTTEIHKTVSTVTARGVVSGAGIAASEFVAASAAGFPWQASLNVSAEEVEFVRAGATATANGFTWNGPIEIARASTLREISVCSLGADGETAARIAAAKAARGEVVSDTIVGSEVVDKEKQLQDEGALAAERKRVKEILATAKEHECLDIVDEAVSAGWTKDQTIAAMLTSVRRSAPIGPMPHRGGSGEEPRTIMGAWLMERAGFGKAAEAAYGPRACQAARDTRINSLLDLCGYAIRAAGRDVPRDRDECIRAAFTSNFDLDVALGSSANKLAQESYRDSPASWRSFCTIKPLNNFHPATVVRAIWGDMQIKAPGGPLKHTTINEGTSTVTLLTYGSVLGLDRTCVINDDLGIFTGAAAAIGRSGARIVSDVVYKTILANADPNGSPFWIGAGNTNYLDGAAYALSAPTLATAMSAMTAQTDGQGHNLDLRARVLLVPPELEFPARAILSSAELARYVTSGAGNDQLPTGNPLFGTVALAVQPRLTNYPAFQKWVYTGSSVATDNTALWFLFAAPTDGAVTVGFLGNREGPTVESVTPPPDELGLMFRGYIDVGCSLTDPRPCLSRYGAAS
jgi:hypothetical protein